MKYLIELIFCGYLDACEFLDSGFNHPITCKLKHFTWFFTVHVFWSEESFRIGQKSEKSWYNDEKIDLESIEIQFLKQFEKSSFWKNDLHLAKKELPSMAYW